MEKVSVSILNLRLNEEIARSQDQVPINLHPEWQRTFELWDEKRRSKLIETIMIGRAMPPVWTIDNSEDKTEDALDGMHRLEHIYLFFNNKWALTGKYITCLNDDLDGKYFKDLSPKLQAQIRKYSINFNMLDDSYHYDANKRQEMYEILNRSIKTLNDYEFNKVIYNPFFELFVPYKQDFKNNFITHINDVRGNIETELIEMFILSKELPNSWSSIAELRQKFLQNKVGARSEDVKEYIEHCGDEIKKHMDFFKKVCKYFKEEKFFISDNKFKSNYVPYKFIISRIGFKYDFDIALFNRHIKYLIPNFKREILDVENIALTLDCKSKNAVFQKKIVFLIEKIISENQSYKPRYFTNIDKMKKLEEQNNKCALCKNESEKFQGDHITEWSIGGETTYENLQMLCIDCHKTKTINFIQSNA